jgi:hypothetical protein
VFVFFHWRPQIEVFEIEAHILCIRCGDNAIPQAFGGCEVGGLRRHVAVVVDEVSSYCKSCPLFSAFCGRLSQTKRPYVTVLCFGTCECFMKKIVSVPFILVPTPCANLPNSFAPDLFHISLNSGSLLSCL